MKLILQEFEPAPLALVGATTNSPLLIVLPAKRRKSRVRFQPVVVGAQLFQVR